MGGLEGEMAGSGRPNGGGWPQSIDWMLRRENIWLRLSGISSGSLSVGKD